MSTVGKMLADVNATLDAAGLDDVRVTGTVRSAKWSSAGLLYFTLTGGRGRVACRATRDLSRTADGTDVTDGANVTVRGHLAVYALRGVFQLTVTSIARHREDGE